jgi:hypothetical protein
VDDRCRPYEEDLIFLSITPDLELRLEERQKLALSSYLQTSEGFTRALRLEAADFRRSLNGVKLRAKVHFSSRFVLQALKLEVKAMLYLELQ